MPIALVNDSDNYTHQIWAQEQANSCAVASIWMARGQARQMSINQDEWNLAWRIYGQVVQGMALVPAAPAPMTLDPRAHRPNQRTFGNMFASAGTYMAQVARALTNEGLTVSTTPFGAGAVVDARRLSDTTPAIVLLGWYGTGTTRNGGHFIVASRVTRSGRVVFLDPWQGQLNELTAGPNYPGGGKFEQVCYISA